MMIVFALVLYLMISSESHNWHRVTGLPIPPIPPGLIPPRWGQVNPYQWLGPNSEKIFKFPNGSVLVNPDLWLEPKPVGKPPGNVWWCIRPEWSSNVWSDEEYESAWQSSDAAVFKAGIKTERGWERWSMTCKDKNQDIESVWERFIDDVLGKIREKISEGKIRGGGYVYMGLLFGQRILNVGVNTCWVLIWDSTQAGHMRQAPYLRWAFPVLSIQEDEPIHEAEQAVEA
ncbi:hypothetical protein [Candidatus Methylacidiphilum infernorum]|uniref:Uncharacterized protein n=1 Tax=Methylacidiphilum infernorum (isolate V4) TaxID=481448 RepID=B3E1D3_METI4|nr:hypothetical protein [Candidatus Methylacidiphilum infernorum]ACD82929.1 Hypothetical protein Minf_0874 [Methylacidiphilum infernorum V4]